MKANQPLVLTDPALLEHLSPRERAFIQHPLVMSDPVQAAKEVGYAESTAAKAHDRFRELFYYIQHYNKQRLAAAGVTQQRIIEELAAIAFADETEYFEAVDTESGETVKRIKDLTRLPAHMRAALKRVSCGVMTDAGVVIPNVFSFELHNKVDALKALAEYFGMKLGKGGGPGSETDPAQRQMLEQLPDDELESLNAIYEKAATRTKAVVDKRRDAKAIDV
jgi:hypothetical protein